MGPVKNEVNKMVLELLFIAAINSHMEELRKHRFENNPNAPYYMEYGTDKYAFNSLDDAKKFAVMLTSNDSHSMSLKNISKEAKIFEKDGTFVVTYKNGRPQTGSGDETSEGSGGAVMSFKW